MGNRNKQRFAIPQGVVVPNKGAGEPKPAEELFMSSTNMQAADLSLSGETILPVSSVTKTEDGTVIVNVEEIKEPVEDEQTDPKTEGDQDSTDEEESDDSQPDAEEVEEGPRDLNKVDVSTWTLEELTSYIAGTYTGQIYRSKLEDAIKAHRIYSADLDAAWTIQECKDFLTQGIVPAKTSKGAWAKDVTRKYRRAHAWVTSELESWALDEIKPEGQTTAQELAHELKHRLVLKTIDESVANVLLAYKLQTGQTTVTSNLTGEIPAVKTAEVTEEVKSTVDTSIQYAGLTTMNQTYIDSIMKGYIATVKPGVIVTRDNGVKAQKQLDNLLRYVITLPDPQGVRSGLDLLLNWIKANRYPSGAFDDTHAFRFTDGLSAQGNVQLSHNSLLTLFFIYTDPNKDVRKQCDVATLLKLLPVQVQPLLMQYFKQVA